MTIPSMTRYFAATTVMVAASPAVANGFAFEAQSARALGAAFAGSQAEKAAPGFAYYNPASIVGSDEVRISVAAVGLFADADYENASGVLFGVAPVAGASDGESVIGDKAFPTAAISTPLSDNLYVGLALNAPFGLDTAFENNSIVRYHALETEVRMISATPIIGAEWAGFSIAAGPRIQYLDFSATGAVDAAGVATGLMIPGFTPGTDDTFYALDGDDVAVGFVAGVQRDFGERTRVGFSFSSEITHEFSGDAAFDTASSVAGQTLAVAGGLFQDGAFSSELVAPATFQLGAQFDATADVTLAASATVTRWSAFEGITIAFDNPAQPDEVLTQDWRDGWAVSAGGEWRATPRDALRAGVMFDASPVSDRFASPRIPDADRVWFTAGYGREVSKRVRFDVSAAYLRLQDRPIALPGTLPENALRGSLSTTIESSAVIVSAGFDLAF